jgi:hypothetical protein
VAICISYAVTDPADRMSSDEESKQPSPMLQQYLRAPPTLGERLLGNANETEGNGHEARTDVVAEVEKASFALRHIRMCDCDCVNEQEPDGLLQELERLAISGDNGEGK